VIKKVKLSLCLTKLHAIRTYKVEVQLHAFLALTLGAVEWSASCPACCTLRERAPQYQLDRRLGGP